MAYEVSEDGDLLISYRGSFDKPMLSIMANNIKQLVPKSEESSKKLFNIFIELSANISKYSTLEGQGLFAIKEFPDYYLFTTGNNSSMDDIEKAENTINRINNYRLNELQEYQRKQIEINQTSTIKGSLGLINISLSAESSIAFLIKKTEKGIYFLTIGVKILKEILK